MIDETPAGARRVTTDELWRVHYEPLRKFCAVVIGPADAEDLAAETFLGCRDRLLSGGVLNPRSYLFRAAVNVAHNLRRARDRERRRNVRVASSPLEADDRPELSHIRDAIRELSPRQRAVLYLAYWEDETEAAIAETLGVHVGTVRRHLHRAHQHLRKALQ